MTELKYEHSQTVPTLRIVWMDLLRGLAILLVVLDHAADQVRSRAPQSIEFIDVFNDAVSPFRMPALMLLSGMLLARSLDKPIKTYAVGKLGKIGWPYLIWSLIILGLLAATSSLTGGTITVGRFARIFYDPPTYLWYLAYLLVFYAVCLFLRSGLIRGLLVPVLLATSAFLPFELKRFVFLFAFFLLGDLISRYRDNFDRITGKRSVIVSAAALGIGTAIIAGTGYTVRYEAVWAVGVIGMVVALIPLLKTASGSRPGVFLAKIGRSSIVFYVSHWAIILVSYHLLVRLGISNTWLLLGAVLAAGLVSGFVMDALRKRFWLLDALYELPPRKSLRSR
jgi:fucose 4-O-acetylase-like acetyltransferase